MSDIEYQFVKGQGWVPKEKPKVKNLSDYVQVEIKRANEDDLLMQYLAFVHDEQEYIVHTGVMGDRYYEARPRRPRIQLTFDEFVQRLNVEEYAFETSLSYNCANGETLGYRVDHPPRHPDLYEISLHRAQQDMYREAARRGF